MTEAATLTALIAPIVARQGFELVRVQLSGGKGAATLQVMAEDPATGQMTLDQCATLSRALSEMLDAEDPIDDEYALEVSSPGIDRPLTRPIDYARWAGHELRLTLAPDAGGALAGRKRLHGTITGIGAGDMVQLDITGAGAVELPFAAIAAAKLVLTNKLIRATRPLDAEGADDIIETATGTANDNDLTDED